MYDIDSATAPVGRAAGDDRDGVVIRVVKDLDLQSLARPVQLTHRVQDALGDVALVVDRHLDADHWLAAPAERGKQGRPGGGRPPRGGGGGPAPTPQGPGGRKGEGDSRPPPPVVPGSAH